MTCRCGATGRSGAERDARIIDVIRALTEGEVATYGDIAEVAGYPGRSRLVGAILAQTSDENDLPWWRVVNASGRLVPGQEREQARLLRAEAVTVAEGRVRAAPHGRFVARPVSRPDGRPDGRS